MRKDTKHFGEKLQRGKIFNLFFTLNSTLRSLKISADEIDSAEFFKYLESENIFVKAFGESNKILKMYLYSRETQNNNYHFVEMTIDFNTLELNYNLKSLNTSISSKYEEYLMKVIEPIL